MLQGNEILNSEMNSKKFIAVFLITLSVALTLPTVGLAHAYWIWKSELRPYDVLPVALVIGTAIEVCALMFIAKVRRPWKALIILLVINVLSILIPFVIYAMRDSSLGLTLAQRIERIPYLIGIIYGFALILFKMPIEFFTLKRDAPSNQKLFWVVLITNIITTSLYAIMERTFCWGRPSA